MASPPNQHSKESASGRELRNMPRCHYHRRANFNHIFNAALMTRRRLPFAWLLATRSRSTSPQSSTARCLIAYRLHNHYQQLNGNEKFFFIAILHEHRERSDFIVRKRKLIKLEAFFMIRRFLLRLMFLYFYCFFIFPSTQDALPCTRSRGAIIISHFGFWITFFLFLLFRAFFFFFLLLWKSN